MNSSDDTILVAEDDSDDVFFLRRAFERAGIETHLRFVRDGEEAIDYLSRAAAGDTAPDSIPKLFVLDLTMPKRDGFDVLDWLQHQPALKRLIVVVLTGSDEPEDVNRAYDMGANSYLMKCQPEHLEELVEKLKHYWLETNFPPNCAMSFQSGREHCERTEYFL